MRLALTALALLALVPAAPRAAKAAPAPGAAPAVKLLSAGESPRAPLRYHLEAGRLEPRQATVQTRADMSFTAGLSEAHEAAWTLTPQVTVEGKTGRAALTLEVSRGGSLVTLTANLDDRGVPAEVRLRGSAGELKTGAATLARELLPTPLPAEPIGRGARWEVTWTSDLRGAPTTLKTLYILEDIGDGGARLGISAETLIPEGTIAIDGRTTVERHLSLGYGEIWLSFTEPLPKAATATHHSVTRVKNGEALMTVADAVRFELGPAAVAGADTPETALAALVGRALRLQEGMLDRLEAHADDPGAAAAALERYVAAEKDEIEAMAKGMADAREMNTDRLGRGLAAHGERLEALGSRVKKLAQTHPDLLDDPRVQEAMAPLMDL